MADLIRVGVALDTSSLSAGVSKAEREFNRIAAGAQQTGRTALTQLETRLTSLKAQFGLGAISANEYAQGLRQLRVDAAAAAQQFPAVADKIGLLVAPLDKMQRRLGSMERRDVANIELLGSAFYGLGMSANSGAMGVVNFANVLQMWAIRNPAMVNIFEGIAGVGMALGGLVLAYQAVANHAKAAQEAAEKMAESSRQAAERAVGSIGRGADPALQRDLLRRNINDWREAKRVLDQQYELMTRLNIDRWTPMGGAAMNREAVRLSSERLAYRINAGVARMAELTGPMAPLEVEAPASTRRPGESFEAWAVRMAAQGKTGQVPYASPIGVDVIARRRLMRAVGGMGFAAPMPTGTKGPGTLGYTDVEPIPEWLKRQQVLAEQQAFASSFVNQPSKAMQREADRMASAFDSLDSSMKSLFSDTLMGKANLFQRFVNSLQQTIATFIADQAVEQFWSLIGGSLKSGGNAKDLWTDKRVLERVLEG